MKTILSILVALGIPAAFWNYYLKEAPDVQYSISTSIPFAFEEAANSKRSKSEYVQQIEVANSGKSEAKRIVIKLAGPISQFYLSKHSASEEPIVTNNSDGFELSYPSLPPSTGFQLTVKTNTDLAVRQVDVFHQAGKARFVSPGAKKSEFGLVDAFWLGVSILYFFMLYLSTRDELKYKYLFRVYSSEIVDLLKSEKPWYVQKREWPEILKDLIERKMSAYVSPYSVVSSWPHYVLLDSDRPADLTQSIWEELKEATSKRFLDGLTLKARQATSKAEIYDLLSLQWPVGISETNREAAIKALSVTYVEYLFAACSVEDLVRILSGDDKPQLIYSEYWERFKGKAEAEVMRSVAEKFIGAISINIEALPEWSVLSPSNRYKLSKLKEFQVKAREADERLEVAGKAVEKADRLESEMRLREAEANASERRNKQLQSKVIQQLNFIERLIADPSFINRIEPYDETFAPGNWELLRKLASVTICSRENK